MWGRARNRTTFAVVIAMATAGAVVGGPMRGAGASRAVRAAATEVDPDSPKLICANGATPLHFAGFENFGDGTPLGSSVSGLTLSGWTSGDFASGNYSGKFPAGDFSSQQTNFATAATATPSIGLTSPASTVSLLVDVAAGQTVKLKAFDATHKLLATTSAVKSPQGRHMIQFGIATGTPNISSLQLTVPPESFFDLDAVCSDDAAMPQGQLTLKYADGPPGVENYIHGFGFHAGERATVTVDGNLVKTCPTIDTNGHFDCDFPMPVTAKPGSNEIVATDSSGTVATANFFVHTDWTQYGFDAQKTGLNPHENVLSRTAVAKGLTLAWTASVGGNQPSSATLAKGVVYVATAGAAAYAFEANSTETVPPLVGTVPTGLPVFPPPTIDGDHVFVDGSDGHIYAFDSQLDVDPVWSYPGQATASAYNYNRAPATLGHVLYAADSAGGHVLAMNEETGKPYWKITLPLPSKVRVHSAPAIDNVHVYIGSDNGTLFAINRADGTIAWQKSLGTQRLGDPVLSSPTASDGRLFIGDRQGSLYAVKTSDGSPVWTKKLTTAVDQSLAVANGVLYVGLSDPAGTLQARSVLAGKLFWALPTGGPITTKPAIADNVVWLTNADGRLVAVDPNGSGSIVTSVALATSTTPSSPVVDNGAVYVGTEEGQLFKYVPST